MWSQINQITKGFNPTDTVCISKHPLSLSLSLAVEEGESSEFAGNWDSSSAQTGIIFVIGSVQPGRQVRHLD